MFDEYCKCGRLQVCAILHNKKCIYAVGYNNFVPHVNIFQRRLQCPSTHAEINALRKVIDTRRNRTKKRPRLDLTVLRKNTHNEYAASKPCKHCIDMMKSLLVSHFINIRNVTYFDGQEFKTESLSTLSPDYVSSGWSHFYDSSSVI